VEAKDIGRPFQDLELSYRPVELRSLIEKAYNERQVIRRADVERGLADGSVQFLEIAVTPLQENNGSFMGVSITFLDVTKFQKLQQDLQRSNQELETAYEELQSTVEELETTNEELQSTVEELETTNEELQSGSEELETMNEELQATNEELETLNGELRMRTGELNTANTFLQSILGALLVGVVVVDRQFNILIWNATVENMWGLRADEVCGHSIVSLDIGLPVERLKTPIQDTLSGKKSRQEIVLDAINRRGKAITCHVTCTPLLDAQKEIQGTVLLIGETKKLAKTLLTPNAQADAEGKKES
jgi:two-component system, chemotaxis family, CheB/CheR fusion protein